MMTHTPSYTMGGKKHDKRDFISPGPGTYEEKSSATKDRVRDTKFSATTRSELVSKDAQ